MAGGSNRERWHSCSANLVVRVQVSQVNARARAAFKGQSLFDRVDGDKLQSLKVVANAGERSWKEQTEAES